MGGSSVYTMGGLADSFYEYLLKMWLQGEFILFTVTFCANPANDLTCPPSYIMI